MKKVFILSMLTVLLWGINLVHAELPADFKFSYSSSAGSADSIATRQLIQVFSDRAIMTRDAKEIGDEQKSQGGESFPVNRDQLEKLYDIVKDSNFMNWPLSPEVEHKSQANESIEVTLDGKIVRHSKWEEANEENFRILYNRFNRWWIDLRSVRF